MVAPQRLRLVQRDHLTFAQVAAAQVHVAHRLPQVQMPPHGNDAARVGQQPLDDAAEPVQIQVAGLLQHLQQALIDAFAHAARCNSASARPRPMFQGSSSSTRLMG